MDQGRAKFNPEKVQEYIMATVIQGRPKRESFREIILDGDQEISGSMLGDRVKVLEKSRQYIDILQKTMDEYDVETKKSISAVRRKFYDRYGDLLDEGHKTIEQAETVKDKIEAMNNQRNNLAIPLVANNLIVNQQQSPGKFDNSGLIE